MLVKYLWATLAGKRLRFFKLKQEQWMKQSGWAVRKRTGSSSLNCRVASKLYALCFFSYSPPRPYLSLSAELHSEPLCSISPSILVPTTPGNRSSASTEYCLLLPSRLRSRATDVSNNEKFNAEYETSAFRDNECILFGRVTQLPDSDAVSLNTFFTVAEKVVFLPSPRVTLAERIIGCPSAAILASRW